MTNEEAIYILRNTAFLAPSLEPIDEAIEMACEALRQADTPQTERGYMWTCPKCGTENHSDFKKCPCCGYTPQTERTCDNCGTPRDKCVYCIEEDRMWTPFKGLADDDDGTLSQTDFVEYDKCFDCEDFFDCDEHQTDCAWR